MSWSWRVDAWGVAIGWMSIGVSGIGQIFGNDP
jgi:hypothetical protein